MNNFEQHCQRLNEFIRIDDDESYMMLATEVLQYMTNALKQLDDSFDYMFKGHTISGSYADDLKVSKPDEFDFVLTMKLPLLKLFKLTKAVPGYVSIDAACLQTYNQPNQRNVTNTAKQFLDSRGYLLTHSFSNWIHLLLDKVFAKLRKVGKSSYMLQLVGGRTYSLSRKRNGPAHTLLVNDAEGRKMFDIDMVFVLMLENTQWMSERRIDTRLVAKPWHLVPKPYKNDASDPNGERYWICSYAPIERMYLAKKNKMKNLIRMFKKMRDNNCLVPIKSYYIKTVFMLHDDTVERCYWNQPMQKLFFEMFERLLKHVHEGSLANYWDCNHNLFGTLSTFQLVDMQRKLQSLDRRLRLAVKTGNWDDLYTVMLTKEERDEMCVQHARTRGATSGDVRKRLDVTEVPKPEETRTCVLQ